MSGQVWDYSPITEDNANQYPNWAGVVAHCERDGERLTAVSGTLKQCRRRIRMKYRKHAKRYPETHPVPDKENA